MEKFPTTARRFRKIEKSEYKSKAKSGEEKIGAKLSDIQGSVIPAKHVDDKQTSTKNDSEDLSILTQNHIKPDEIAVQASDESVTVQYQSIQKTESAMEEHNSRTEQLQENASSSLLNMIQSSRNEKFKDQNENSETHIPFHRKVKFRKLSYSSKCTNEDEIGVGLSFYLNQRRARRSYASSDVSYCDGKADECPLIRNVSEDVILVEHKKMRPNFFVSVRISNDHIWAEAEKVTTAIIEKHSELKDCKMPIEKLHITLFVLSLPSDEEINKAIDVFKSCQTLIPPTISISNLSLTFQGLGSFSKDVLFMKIMEDEGMEKLQALIDHVGDCFFSAGLISEKDIKRLKPHATLMKVSRVKKRKKPQIKKEYFEEFKDWSFGTHSVESLEFLRMQGLENNYYPVIEKIPFKS